MPDLENPTYWRSLINIGLSKFFILKVLYERPAHGYGILKELTCLTEGCCTPTFGTIYPILMKLAKEDYAKVVRNSKKNTKRKRKIYVLTPKGRRAYRIALETWRSTIPFIYKSIDFEYTDEGTEEVYSNK